MDINIISAIIFYIVIFLIIYLNRKKFDIKGVIALYRTKIGLKFMDRIAKSCPRLLNVISIVGIYVCFAGLLFITYYLAQSLYKILTVPDSTPAISLLIPGVKIPGFIYVPFWYGIVSLFLVIVIHEFSHGVIARLHDIRVNSSGVGMLAIFPLAFVEPDEKQLVKKKKKQQLSVYAAGPFSNILTAAIILLIVLFAVVPLENSAFKFEGIVLDSVEEGTPAYEAGLKAGDNIIGIDGVLINETNIQELLTSKKPGDSVIFQTTEENLTVMPIAHKDDGVKPYYGIYMKAKIEISEAASAKFGKFPYVLLYLREFLSWLFTLSLGIGMANLLPLGPVDGGRMTLTFLTVFFKEQKARHIWKNISFIVLLLLILNLAIPFIRKFIHPAL